MAVKFLWQGQEGYFSARKSVHKLKKKSVAGVGETGFKTK